MKRAERPIVEPGSTSEPPASVLEGDDNAQSSQLEPSDDAGSE